MGKLNDTTGGRPIMIPTYPESYPVKSPTTVEEARAASSREDFIAQALAPYLIVANENIWWSYAWFYDTHSGWYPCSDNSCIGPKEWYPSFAKPLGAPLGPPVCDGGFKWKRSYARCEVQVDLENPSASVISWHELDIVL